MKTYFILIFIFLGILNIVFYKKLAIFYNKHPMLMLRRRPYSIKYHEFVNILTGILAILMGSNFLFSNHSDLSFLIFFIDISFIIYGLVSMFYSSKLTLFIDKHMHYPKTIDIKYFKVINFIIGVCLFSFGIWSFSRDLFPNI